MPRSQKIHAGSPKRHRPCAVLSVFFTAGCLGTVESAIQDELQSRAATFDIRPPSHEAAPSQESESAAFDGSLDAYLRYALKQSPTIRASFERWKAATLRISRARRLPEPTVSYGYYVQNVETRVGPQRHRLGLAQTFPWFTKLSAGADAASFSARAAQRRFDAEVLALRMKVENAYWRLWFIQEEHRLKSEHDLVLENLAGTVRGRVETGRASLADLNQVELGVARHHDHHGQHREATRAAWAEILSIIGAPASNTTLRAADAPEEGLPRESDEALGASAYAHPRIERYQLMASASEAQADAEAADRFPRFRLGFDYIETGEARMPNVPGSGDDAMIASLGLSIPLWFGSYDDAEEAALAESRAHLADRKAAQQRTDAELEGTLAAVRDAQRRIALYRDTLLLQAQTTFRSVLGGYQTGRSTVAASLLAQKDLLELQIELARAKADHARAFARLEHIVGRPIKIGPNKEIFHE